MLVDDYGGEVPEDRAALERLPGVGRKTANVVLNTAFGHETFAVDTHIFRVCNRTGLAKGKTVLAVELKLGQGDARSVPAPRASLADPARPLYLQARRPECWRCPVEDLCAYRPKDACPCRQERKSGRRIKRTGAG